MAYEGLSCVSDKRGGDQCVNLHNCIYIKSPAVVDRRSQMWYTRLKEKGRGTRHHTVPKGAVSRTVCHDRTL